MRLADPQPLRSPYTVSGTPRLADSHPRRSVLRSFVESRVPGPTLQGSFVEVRAACVERRQGPWSVVASTSQAGVPDAWRGR